MAKASGTTITRRAALSGGVAVTVGSSLPARPGPVAACSPTEQGAIAAELARLFAAHTAAVNREMSLEVREGQPGWDAYQQAVRSTQAASDRLEALSDMILSRPIEQWEDVCLLAELCAVHADREADGRLTLAARPLDLAQEALGALVEGVLRFGRVDGRNGEENMQRM